ncbi:hypothetical protein PI126_g18303 [Phytophthora idaei]|nr:hypothetical protein PI126_g18303 [Phytophthora idaei]
MTRFAEFLGTFVMIVFGMGVNNQVTNSQDANGTWLSINMCWGIGVLIGVYCSEGISGAHFNTAVTLAHCVLVESAGLHDLAASGRFLRCLRDLRHAVPEPQRDRPNRETTQSSFSTYPSDRISNIFEVNAYE